MGPVAARNKSPIFPEALTPVLRPATRSIAARNHSPIFPAFRRLIYCGPQQILCGPQPMKISQFSDFPDFSIFPQILDLKPSIVRFGLTV
jgi:hypothetical protein